MDERINDALEIYEVYELCVTEVAIIGGCFKKPKNESMRMQQYVIAWALSYIGSEKTCHVANLLILRNGPV